MDRKRFYANILAPEKIMLTVNIANHWWKFQRNFLNYSIASRLPREPDIAY